MKRFARTEFESASEQELAGLCRNLGAELSQRLREGDDFHESIRSAIEKLRRLGHELWSYAESPGDEETPACEKWCAEWTGKETLNGELILTFTAPTRVEVTWRPPDGNSITSVTGAEK